jgi:outer membrane protein assembly factor BamE (lipoprotein component of BamABCDE complex)
MTHVKLILSAIALTMFLAACVSSGTKVEQAQISAFVPGQTTYDQVVASLGAPNGAATTADGRRMAVYSYVHSQARPETFIPLIGPFIGGADATSSSVTFIFDQSGVLQSGASSQGQTSMGMELATTSTQTATPIVMPASTGVPAGGRALGINVAPVSKQLATTIGLGEPEGAFVAAVAPGSAAEHGGIQQGDVILQIGYAVIDTLDRLRKTLAAVPYGSTAAVIVWRNRARVTLSVVM